MPSPHLRMAPMLAFMAAIFLLSHQPGSSFDLPLFPGADKAAHLIIYCLLAASIIAALTPAFRRSHRIEVALITCIVAILYGVSDEFHQSFIPGRESSGADLIADAAGAGIACLVWLVTHRTKN